MDLKQKLVSFSIEKPKAVVTIMTLATIILLALVTWRALTAEKLVDADPENMLSQDAAVRVFHREMKKDFDINDIIVLGVANETHKNGVFNPESLKKINELVEFSKTLKWPDEHHPDKMAGVVDVDIIAPSTVDNIEQGGLGVVRFEWLMEKVPETEEDALKIMEKAERLPFLKGTLLSEDGKALCVYLPITTKHLSNKIYTELNKKIKEFEGDDHFFITGLPVAEDVFSVEMFKQMAVSAPIAMLIIFILMYVFFKKVTLIISPMIIAIVSVIWTMGLLIVAGFSIHIMSSMIPIFIMPIAVLNSIHILSTFFNTFQQTKDRKETLYKTFDILFKPMLFTTLTTVVGFGSLVLTPIPPVQVFGFFVGLGVLLAWFWSLTFIPAFIMLLSEKSLKDFGALPQEDDHSTGTMLSKALLWVGHKADHHQKLVVGFMFVLAIVAIIGISRINVNDNPTKWFESDHPIRVADKVLNKHFAGTYMGYLALLGPEQEKASSYVKKFLPILDQASKDTVAESSNIEAIYNKIGKKAQELSSQVKTKLELLMKLEEYVNSEVDQASDEDMEVWDQSLQLLSIEKQKDQVFKNPEVLNYISDLQDHIVQSEKVGKSNSLADVVKTVHRELFLGKDSQYKIPDSSNAVAQCLLTYQGSHRPQDLWHFVTPDYNKTNLWIQLKSGDNQDMEKVVQMVDEYVKEHPIPQGIKHDWFGLTYINVIWQENMVFGMMEAFLGSFLIVFVMMLGLFRSAVWGIVSMVPLSVSIALIYGSIGLIGKDYDMPIAVLSSLSLGLGIDFAIHFLVRGGNLHRSHDEHWSITIKPLFGGGTAEAIARNAIVVGVGFLPLIFAPLVPYQTVGIFISAILLIASISTLVFLPSIIGVLERQMFGKEFKYFTCNTGACLLASLALSLFIAISVKQFLGVDLTTLGIGTAILFLIFAAGCFFAARQKKCNE